LQERTLQADWPIDGNAQNLPLETAFGKIGSSKAAQLIRLAGLLQLTKTMGDPQ
jgi:hypothetical protein